MKNINDPSEKPNSYETTTDLEHWSKLTIWTPEEAAILSLGEDPHEINLEDIKNLRDSSPLHREIFKRTELFKRALLAQNKHLSPNGYIQLGKIKGINFPNKLTTLIEERVKNWNQNQSQNQTIIQEQSKKDKNNRQESYEEITHKNKKLTRDITDLRRKALSKSIIIAAFMEILRRDPKYGAVKLKNSLITNLTDATASLGNQLSGQNIRNHIKESTKTAKAEGLTKLIEDCLIVDN
jgi:hypothetical protein